MKPIWIVDDDQSIRFVLEKALAREDLAVRSFTNARDVLAALDDVLDVLRCRPAHVHVVLTGRQAPEELVALADTVTEMTLVKHHYQIGVPAQRGIED